MGIRDSLNNSPILRGVVVICAVVGVGAAVYLGFRPTPEESVEFQPAEMTTMRCTACGNTAQAKTSELVEKNQLDPIEYLSLIGDARKCSKCGKETMAVVRQPTP